MASNGASTCSASDGFQVPPSAKDLARDAEVADDPVANVTSENIGIEDVHVDDDPRKWSNMWKVGSSFTKIDFQLVTASATFHWHLP
jgi:hypothetical protein